MQSSLLYLTTKHTNAIAAQLPATNPAFQEQWNVQMGQSLQKFLNNDAGNLTGILMNSKIMKQSLVLANTEIFRTLFWIGIVFTVVVFLYQHVREIILFFTRNFSGAEKSGED